jgi:hypothetical protein
VKLLKASKSFWKGSWKIQMVIVVSKSTEKQRKLLRLQKSAEDSKSFLELFNSPFFISQLTSTPSTRRAPTENQKFKLKVIATSIPNMKNREKNH